MTGTGYSTATFDVVMSPPGGHGDDIYRELGAYNVLLYSRIENDVENPDFITGQEFARVGIVQNPEAYGSTENLELDKLLENSFSDFPFLFEKEKKE